MFNLEELVKKDKEYTDYSYAINRIIPNRHKRLTFVFAYYLNWLEYVLDKKHWYNQFCSIIAEMEEITVEYFFHDLNLTQSNYIKSQYAILLKKNLDVIKDTIQYDKLIEEKSKDKRRTRRAIKKLKKDKKFSHVYTVTDRAEIKRIREFMDMLSNFSDAQKLSVFALSTGYVINVLHMQKNIVSGENTRIIFYDATFYDTNKNYEFIKL